MICKTQTNHTVWQAALFCLYFCSSFVVDGNAAAATTTTANSKPKQAATDSLHRMLWIKSLLPITICASLVFVRIPFPTVQDELHFWLSIMAAVAMAIVALWLQDQNRAAEACMYALIVLADAVYRTPENPYASILCILFAIDQWQKVMQKFCFLSLEPSNPHGTAGSNNMHVDNMDLLLSTVYMCLTIELGLVPQFNQQEDWPIYAGIGAFATFAAAWYRSTN